ncbi:hypothetical protein [Aneurinibacillus terranovensis]|uniref:hypothetical protein n=1 Tax=Aneurinibacillus terranovensis TaxID=278991 RepID=UPI0004016BFC|nr:hypothetical protein [Aneurinibacillus terranovensis]
MENDILNQILSEIKALRSDVTDLKEGQQRLEQGQVIIKEAINHNTALLTENFTNIRKDLRTVTNDIKADVNLLFKEVESVKRHTNRLEQRVGNQK